MKVLMIIFIFMPVMLIAQERVKGAVTWNNQLFVNAGLKGGNSETLEIGGEFLVSRNELWVNEWTIKANGSYQTGRTNLLGQNAGASVRFGWSITPALYNFYRLEIKHNILSKIVFGYLPTAGMGYWLFDNSGLKCLIEAGFGYNGIHYTDDLVKGEIILQARFFLEWIFLENFIFGNDTYYFPGLTFQTADSGFYFKIKSDKLAAKFALDLQYTTQPAEGLLPLDYMLKTGLEWSF